MKKTKTRKISARINEETYQIIKQSEYSFGDALDWFAGNLTTKDNQKYVQLKLLEEEKSYLEKKLLNNELEIMEIQEEIGDKTITGKEYNKPIIRAVQNTLVYYKEKYKDIYSIDDFLEARGEYLIQNASRCGLEVEELKELVLTKFTKEQNQSILM